MRRAFSNILVVFVAFAAGIIAVWVTVERTTLENISSNVSTYDGRLVEFETYAQVDAYDGYSTWLGQPFEKRELMTNVRFKNEYTSLRVDLAESWSEKEYSRMPVIAKGVIHDNCSHGSTCCFGQSLTLSDAEITPFGPIERFRPPSR